MKFYKEVIANLFKTAFEGHAKFSVADDTAVGTNPIRSISLDAVPVNDDVLISLSWEGGEKLFEKKLSEQESSHQFDLISTDLSEVAALTKQGQYDVAKDLMKKLGQKYAENTGDIVDTNLPKLHNTQASQDDDKIWRKAKITMQNLWFSTTDELLEYQEKQKGAKSNQDHIPLWDAQKGKAPEVKDELAPASLSYDDLENEKERNHEDMTKHIDEKIKTELESALQEKAASVFGPADIELVKSLRAPGIGRNWDEIKKIFIKDLNRDKDATTIFLDEQRQSLDPAGIEVEPVKEEEKPLTPPEDLVSPETHEKLLQDHEDKKKIDSPVKEDKELNFTPKDVMDIPEDEEIEKVESLSNEIARADNDEIHKVAAPSDLNPLQEPLTEQPTTPSQDVVPMGKKPLDHDAPQHGDRVFVTTDLSSEKSGFEANFINPFKGNRGEDLALVETDQGDQLEVALNRVVKINEGSGAQDTEPVMEPLIEQQQPSNEVPVTPKMDDFHTSSLKTDATRGTPINTKGPFCKKCWADDKKLNEKGYCAQCAELVDDKESSQDPLLAIKLEAEALLKEVEGMGKTSYIFIRKGLEKHADDSAFEGNGWCRVWVQEDEIASDSRYPEILKLPDENAKTAALKELARELAQEALRLADSAGAKVGVQSWFDSLKPSDHDRIDWVKLANPQAAESSLKQSADGSACIKCHKVFPLDQMISNEHGAGYLCKADAPAWNKEASDFEKGISQNKTSDDESTCALCGNKIINGNGVNHKGRPYCKSCAEGLDIYGSQNKTSADPVEAPKTQFKDYKITPKYTPKEQAIPATPELADVLAKMDSLQSNLATLEAARKQIQAKMKEELNKIDQTGERVQMEAALQESVEKAGILISAMDNKVVQYKDKLYTLQTEQVDLVPGLTLTDWLEKFKKRFDEAEKFIADVKNGMLSQAKRVVEKTLIRWPNKKSSMDKEASILDDFNHYNEELLAALKLLSQPLE